MTKQRRLKTITLPQWTSCLHGNDTLSPEQGEDADIEQERRLNTEMRECRALFPHPRSRKAGWSEAEQLSQNLLVKAGMSFEPGMSSALHWQL